MNSISSELTRYHRLNSVTQSGCAVLFGSSRFAGIPVGELARDLGVDTPVYNRSVAGLTLQDAESALTECIYPLGPSKVFINLGEDDLALPTFDVHAFLSAYEWLLYTINSRLNGQTHIYIVSVLSAHPAASAINESLERLAYETGCVYIDATRAIACEHSEVRIFEILRRFLRGRTIHFGEALQIGQHILT